MAFRRALKRLLQEIPNQVGKVMYEKDTAVWSECDLHRLEIDLFTWFGVWKATWEYLQTTFCQHSAQFSFVSCLRIYLDKSYWLFKHLMPLLRFIKKDKNFRVKAVYRRTNKYVICLWCLRPSYPNHRCKHIKIQCLRLYDKFCTNLLFNALFFMPSLCK